MVGRKLERDKNELLKQFPLVSIEFNPLIKPATSIVEM